MRLPEIIDVTKQTVNIGVFGGINQTDITVDNEFSVARNISSDMFPGIVTSKERGEIIRKLDRPNGLYWKNGICYVDGSGFYYKNERCMDVSDSEKQIIGMGAYIIVWPDKKVYNTATGEVKSVEVSYVQSGSISVAPVSSGSTFIKITGTGIGKPFERFDSVMISGFTQYGEKLNVSKTIQEKADNYIVVLAAGVGSFTQGSGVKVKRTAPDMDYICEFNNRLWGCSSKNHEIYACKLGDPLNWNSFEGISTDSYAVSIGSDGDFTGCIPHQGYVVFFKEDVIHTVYGTKPSNFQIDTILMRGVAKGCEKSLCRVDETIYYAARKDICAFEGSIPEKISNKLTMRYTEARANQYESKLMLSLKDTSGNWHLYVYDADKSQRNNTELWYEEDEAEICYSVFAEGKLYIIDGENNLREIYKEQRFRDWELVSGKLEEGMLTKKKVHKIRLNIDLQQGSLFELYVRYDGEAIWRRVKTIIADERKTYVIPLKLKRCGYYEIRMRGVGECKIFGMQKIIESGSDR